MASYPETKAPLMSTAQILQPQPIAYSERPNDYKTWTLVTAILCGIFSPLTLALTIPAYISARKSHEAANKGDLKTAWERGVLAAGLNVAAITLGLVVAALCIGLILPLYDPDTTPFD